ncbi:MAG TPA: transporter substrate-binding domain-containing protein [Spirochaetota bacterium]|nr:transporter substrate-binding domain-containing protein [Spirochaetota bacterium]
MPLFKKTGLLIGLFLFASSLYAEQVRIYYGAGSSSFPPFEYIDDYGRPSGFNIDIINAIEDETGLDIHVTLMPGDEAVKKFSSDKIDFLTCVFHDRNNSTGKFYSSPGINVQFIAAFPVKQRALSGPFTGKRIAVNRGYELDLYLAAKYPESLMIYTDTDFSALKLVSSGETDCAILSLNSANYLIERHRINDLRLSERPVFSIEYSMKFSPRNKELMDKLNEGMAAIKKNGEFSRIYLKWFSHSGRILDDKKMYGLLAVLVALAIASILIILFYILLRREVSRRTRELNKEISHNYFIADLSKKLLGGASIENISRILLEYLAELTGSHNGFAGYIGSESTPNISVFIYSRINGEVSFRKPEIIAGFTPQMKKKIFEDRDSFFSNEASLIFDANESMPVSEIKNALCSPAVIGETVVGFIIMGDSYKDYDSEDLNIIENFSSQYALAIQRMWFEHDLIRSEKKYRDIFNNVEDLLYIYDLQGNILEVNSAFQKLFGYSEDELKKMNLVTLLSSADHGYYTEADVVDMLKRIISEGAIYSEVKFRNRYGKKIIIEYKNTLIFDDTGNPVSIQGSARDITERKIFEKMLIEAREKARESDSLKTNFLANMSHEMRTPLNAVIGFTDILIEEINEPAHENYLRMIQKSGKLLLSIINEILDLSKIESGSLKIIEAPFSIKSLIKNVYNSTFVLVRAGKKNINLDFDCDHNISELINGDEHRIEQVMNNLLSNAVKFTDSGEINFGVNLNSSGMMEFYVEDSGIGISEENLPLVFERFRQVDYSSRRSYSGTGLGLSISKMIVEMMGGTIYVESELNKGSKFVFTVPYKPSSGETGIKPDRDTSASSGKTVLVVEDNHINRLLVSKVLEKNGFTCIVAVDGFEAVEEYKSGRHIDIILMDIQMPRMDGLEALGIIREIEQKTGKARTPIVALSAHVMKEDVQKFLESGFDSYIAKPFNRDDLIRGIIELTEK